MSLPTVIVGLTRYARRGAFAERQALVETVVPMSLSSLIGAMTGGMLVGLIPAATLKMALGVILNVSAVRIFAGTRDAGSGRAISPDNPSP